MQMRTLTGICVDVYIYILYVTCTLIIMVHAQTIHMELWNMDIVTIIVETYWKHKGLLYIYI